MPRCLGPSHPDTNARCAAMTIRPYTPRNSARSVGAADCSMYVADGWARAWRKTKRCHAHPIAQPGGEHLPRQSTPIMCVQPGSVRVVCTRVRARVEPGATTGAREYTGSSSLTFPAPAHNHAELSGGNRHSAHRGAKRADVLGVTHRLPPLALDLCTGAASVSARRRSPVSAADPTARGVAASRARVKKKRTKLSFFLTHSNGKRRPVAGVGGTKISWGRAQKKDKIFPPPTNTHSHHYSARRAVHRRAEWAVAVGAQPQMRRRCRARRRRPPP